MPALSIPDRQPNWIMATAGFLALLSALLYFVLLTRFNFDPFVDNGYGLVFNDMLLRLLRGDFTIDPEIIGLEGFKSGGKVYSYFGIFSALARLPLLPFVDLKTQPVSTIMCTVAAAGCVFFYAASVLTVAGERVPRSVTGGLLAACALAGIPFYLMKTSAIYNEPVLWAACFSATFIFVLSRHIASDSELSVGSFAALAAVAGLCLLARFSTGFGLSLATTFLILRAAWLCRPSSFRFSDIDASWRHLLLPIAILAFFSGAACFVNYMRWGNPFEFIDLTKLYVINASSPDRVIMIHDQGITNIHRLWFGLQYYFFPIWGIPSETGKSIFSEWMRTHIHGAEVPPTSFLLTDSVWLVLAAFGIKNLVRAPKWTRTDYIVVLTAAALIIPAIQMLMHLYMALRYRGEFQPVMMIFAIYGLKITAPGLGASKRTRALLLVCAASSIVFSQLTFKLPITFGPTDNMDLRAYYHELYQSVHDRISGIERFISFARQSP